MPSTMLAGRLNLTTGKFAMETVAIPEPGPDEVRIKVSAAGICLSDRGVGGLGVHAVQLCPAFGAAPICGHRHGRRSAGAGAGPLGARAHGPAGACRALRRYQLVTLTCFRRLDFSASVSEILPPRDAPLGVERLIKKQGNPIRLVLRP